MELVHVAVFSFSCPYLCSYRLSFIFVFFFVFSLKLDDRFCSLAACFSWNFSCQHQSQIRWLASIRMIKTTNSRNLRRILLDFDF